jgi:hypothetical protein
MKAALLLRFLPQIAGGLGALSVLATGAAAIQTARFHARGETIRALEAMIDSVAEFQKVAGARQLEVFANQERHYAGLAITSDRRHREALAHAGADADRYIAAHRLLRAQIARGASGAAAAPAPGDDTGLPEELPADRFVAVSDDDVRRCTAATRYALDAFEWARGLNDGPEPLASP